MEKLCARNTQAIGRATGSSMAPTLPRAEVSRRPCAARVPPFETLTQAFSHGLAPFVALDQVNSLRLISVIFSARYECALRIVVAAAYSIRLIAVGTHESVLFGPWWRLNDLSTTSSERYLQRVLAAVVVNHCATLPCPGFSVVSLKEV
jgi:hypothetical protein